MPEIVETPDVETRTVPPATSPVDAPRTQQPPWAAPDKAEPGAEAFIISCVVAAVLTIPSLVMLMGSGMSSVALWIAIAFLAVVIAGGFAEAAGGRRRRRRMQVTPRYA